MGGTISAITVIIGLLVPEMSDERKYFILILGFALFATLSLLALVHVRFYQGKHNKTLLDESSDIN